ncbi:hypothetical protein A994_11617 [Methanobacterium formicicum DSM 3637]|uniref:Uncharacterized protein n=1 Tax=Methanobacterium formicicum (strain DSM 3637 / PP1) TaxID=1204725 RepID=K2RQ42_METFP|nr:hypothetical protein A994_11617 [Methanobacterium formicicum DSM 3637]
MSFFYINIIAGIGFLIAGILTLYKQRKNPSENKYMTLAGFLLILAGICQFISVVSYFYELNF